MDYMTLKEASEKWGVTPRQINYLCAGGRIPGAVKMATIWLIPKDAEKPAELCCCFPVLIAFPVFHYSAGTGQKKERAAKMLPFRCNLDARSLVLYNEYERGFYHVP